MCGILCTTEHRKGKITLADNYYYTLMGFYSFFKKVSDGNNEKTLMLSTECHLFPLFYSVVVYTFA